MILINHDLKAIYIQIPKCGENYICDILTNFYNFEVFMKITRDDIVDFFDNDEQLINSLEFYNSNMKSIRKMGFLRYALNNEDSDNLQNMDSDKWKEYYKFTFVRNPYEKFYSILSCYKNKKFNDDVNSFHSDKNLLLENKELCSNYMYCMTFINQYEHLLDYTDNLNMQFIGSVEYLDRDLLIILNQLGVKDVRHFQYLEQNNKNSFYYNNFSEFNSFYDNEILNKINELFKTDFDCFGYKMINDILRIDQKPVCTDIESNDINNIKKECFVINLLETHKENKKKMINKSNSEFCEIIEGLYN